MRQFCNFSVPFRLSFPIFFLASQAQFHSVLPLIFFKFKEDHFLVNNGEKNEIDSRKLVDKYLPTAAMQCLKTF